MSTASVRHTVLSGPTRRSRRSLAPAWPKGPYTCPSLARSRFVAGANVSACHSTPSDVSAATSPGDVGSKVGGRNESSRLAVAA
ncbi:hypothetical protein [Halospeciosus flavus]|uniref:Uncharacterized protein n=1 Tax=Halospeciosus flavus TaxID=3032283 RepID=A0ABD5Z9A1_9EURY|nr:hypothetical protein [Halospeciosus flavus]